jgi:hypothetical protein
MSLRIIRSVTLFILLAVTSQTISLAQEGNAVADRQARIESETKARLTLQSELNSKMNQVGDEVIATLAEPVYVDGQTVLRRGTEFRGRVTKVSPAKRGQRSSHMSIRFDRVITSRGELPISAEVTAIDDWDQEVSTKANNKGELKGGHHGDKTLENTQRGGQIGFTGGLAGAALGGAAGASGRLALGIGAGGVVAGLIGGLLLTKGRELRARPGAILRIRFNEPVMVPVAPDFADPIH